MLESELILGDFTNLKYLYCHSNKLTKIDLRGCPNLISINCKDNKLKELVFDKELLYWQLVEYMYPFFGCNDLQRMLSSSMCSTFDNPHRSDSSA